MTAADASLNKPASNSLVGYFLLKYTTKLKLAGASIHNLFRVKPSLILLFMGPELRYPVV